MKKAWTVCAVLIASMALAMACGGQEPIPTTLPTAISALTSAPTPTNIPTPTATLVPSPIPAQTAMASPAPTAKATPQLSPTPVPTPTATPEPSPIPEPTPTPTEPVEMHIIAADGGVIEADDSRLILEIPPGGLTEDIVVSITPVDPNVVPGPLGGSQNIRIAYRLEPSGLRFEKPVVVSLRIPGGGLPAPDSNEELLHFLFIQAEGQDPKLAENLVAETTQNGDLVIRGEISHFSTLFDYVIPDNKTYCTQQPWEPNLPEYNESFVLPITIGRGNASLTVDFSMVLKPTVTICAGFHDSNLEVSLDASAFESSTLDLSANGTLEELWTSPAVSFPLGVIFVGPIPIIPQVDLFVQARAGVGVETSVRFEQSATTTINVSYDGAWKTSESVSCQGSQVQSLAGFLQRCVQTTSSQYSLSGSVQAYGWAQLSFQIMWAGGPYIRTGSALLLEGGEGGGQPDWWTVCGEILAGYGITGNPILFGAGVAPGKEFTLWGPALINKSSPLVTSCGEAPVTPTETTQVDRGVYTLLLDQGSNSFIGKVVSFRVSDLLADQTANWKFGGFTELNLTASAGQVLQSSAEQNEDDKTMQGGVLASPTFQPVPPHLFTGTVHIDGFPAPLGTSISAWIDGVSIGSTTVDPVSPTPGLTGTGDIFDSLGSNLKGVWRFVNSSQTWDFYIPATPFFAINTYTDSASGDIVWVEVKGQQKFQGNSLFPGWNLIFLSDGFTTVSPQPELTETEDVFSSLVGANDNLIRIWRFISSLQSWGFYDPRPAFIDANTYTNSASGDIVWVEVKSQQKFQGSSLFPGWNLISLK